MRRLVLILVAALALSACGSSSSPEDDPESGPRAPPSRWSSRPARPSPARPPTSRTTVFLSELVRVLYPESEFVRQQEAFEATQGVTFEDDGLRLFGGPSVTVYTPEDFAARSALADPDRMRELLPELAPALPDILGGLQGLGQIGLGALLFVAPDAPLTSAATRIRVNAARLADEVGQDDAGFLTDVRETAEAAGSAKDGDLVFDGSCWCPRGRVRSRRRGASWASRP